MHKLNEPDFAYQIDIKKIDVPENSNQYQVISQRVPKVFFKGEWPTEETQYGVRTYELKEYRNEYEMIKVALKEEESEVFESFVEYFNTFAKKQFSTGVRVGQDIGTEMQKQNFKAMPFFKRIYFAIFCNYKSMQK